MPLRLAVRFRGCAGKKTLCERGLATCRLREREALQGSGALREGRSRGQRRLDRWLLLLLFTYRHAEMVVARVVVLCVCGFVDEDETIPSRVDDAGDQGRNEGGAAGKEKKRIF